MDQDFFQVMNIEDGKIFSAFCYGSIDTAIANQLSDKDIDKTENGIGILYLILLMDMKHTKIDYKGCEK